MKICFGAIKFVKTIIFNSIKSLRIIILLIAVSLCVFLGNIGIISDVLENYILNFVNLIGVLVAIIAIILSKLDFIRINNVLDKGDFEIKHRRGVIKVSQVLQNHIISTLVYSILDVSIIYLLYPFIECHRVIAYIEIFLSIFILIDILCTFLILIFIYYFQISIS